MMAQSPLLFSEQPRSRLSAIHSNVRNMLRNPIPSSVYSRSPRVSTGPIPAVPELPQLPQLAFLRGEQQGQHGQRQLPQQQSQLPTRNRQPDWISPSSATTEESDEDTEKEINEEFEVNVQPPDFGTHAPLVEGSRSAPKHQRRTRRHKSHKRGAWVRKKKEKRGLWHGKTRMKCFGALVSAFLIAVLLAIYLGLALSLPHVGQGVHIIFILSILAATIFFAHCLIRLCMLARQGPALRRKRRRVKGVCGPDGFQPGKPMRVHVVADEEALVGFEGDRGHLEGHTEAHEGVDGQVKKVKVPPPAYGLWRSSVRLNPNLLHWARVQHAPPLDKSPVVSPSSAGSERSPEMQQREQEIPVPRPPSYVSEDGISYAVNAVPRSTVFVPEIRPPSRLHPALRSVRGSRTLGSDVEEMTIPVGLGLD